MAWTEINFENNGLRNGKKGSKICDSLSTKNGDALEGSIFVICENMLFNIVEACLIFFLALMCVLYHNQMDQ